MPLEQISAFYDIEIVIVGRQLKPGERLFSLKHKNNR